jgi:O-acetylhomoserine (thiol)-lyase
MRNETKALHAGYHPDTDTHSLAVPIYQTAAYAFDDANHGAELFNLEREGFRYTRINNPTTSVLDKRIAALEGGVGALSVSSGQTALHHAILNVCTAGTNIVSPPQLYGTTHTLFQHYLPNFGIKARLAESDSLADIEKLIDYDTRAVFCESVGNPAGNVCDIESLAAIAHRYGVPLIVDNTVATPIMLRPIDYGADVVVHSLTKYLGGHGTSLGGAIIDGGNFQWEHYPSKYPMFNQPDQSYHGMVYIEHFGRTAYIERCRSFYQRVTGAVLSPFNAFLLLQGIETVALRVERHVANGKAAADFLRSHHKVEWVNYAGFPENPYYALTKKYFAGNACALMSFGVQGGYDGGTRFYDALKLISRCVNLGDAKSLACHPASTTHRQMPPAVQRAAGVLPETIRLSVGIEHIDDIIADLSQALECA